MRKMKSKNREGDHDYHFEFWVDSYEKIKRDCADDVIRLLRLNKRFKEREFRMKVIDENRREHAFHMGVSVEESDKEFNFDELIKSTETYLKLANANLEQLGTTYAAFVKDDEPTLETTKTLDMGDK